MNTFNADAIVISSNICQDHEGRIEALSFLPSDTLLYKRNTIITDDDLTLIRVAQIILDQNGWNLTSNKLELLIERLIGIK